MFKKTHVSTLLFIAIFFAGFCFLLFEINLFRAISHLLGSTVTASTLVLSVFMGGYGFGSLFLGKKAVSVSNKLQFFSAVLIWAGLGGALSYFAVNHLFSHIYEMLFSVNAGKIIADLTVYLIVIVCLFIPSFFMGGILPVATQLLSQTQQEIPVKIGHVYALDTLGSAIGGLLTGFVLNRFLGQNQSVIMGTVMLLIIGGFILLKAREKGNDIILEKFQDTDTKKKPQDKNIRVAALLSTLLFGFAVTGMQVLLIRVFKIYLLNAVYSFSLITSLIILGLFIGSWTFKTLNKKREFTVKTLVNMVMATGLLIPFILLIMLNLPQWVMFPLGNIFDNNLFRVLVIPVLSTVITVLPLAFLSGFAFPLANSLYADSLTKVSEQIGKTVMFNAIGSVFGPLVAAFILMNFFGVSRAMLILAGLVFICALILTKLVQKIQKTKLNYLLGIACLLLIIIVLASDKQLHILPPSYAKGNKKIIAVKEGVEGMYVVGEESSGNNKVITTHVNNSVVIGTSYDAIKAVKMVGHLPFLLGSECENALIVGFGIGVTTAAISMHPTVESIDCVELVPDLTKIAHFYEYINHNIQKDKRLRFIGDDGRHFLKTTDKKYDLISSDPTHPILGSGNIYTKEYFELCRAHLTSKGMVSQYLPLHKLRLQDLLGIIKTFHSVFPYSSLWLGHYHGILIGSMELQNVDFQQWTANMAATTKDELFYNNPYHVAASLIFDNEAMSKVTVPYKINTDNIAYTDYFAFESLKEENLLNNLQFFNENREGIERYFTNVTDTVLLQRFIKGNINLTTGLYHSLQGNHQDFYQYLEKARMVNPENEEYPLLIHLEKNYKQK